MITDQQVRRLVKMRQEGRLYQAADKTGMSEKTARKYLKLKKLPSEMRVERDWKTRADAFEEVWPKLRQMLELNSGLEATTLLPYLIREQPEIYQESQLRTLQRRVRNWRSTEGPSKEVMFEQVHHPGILSESDFTHMDELGITIAGEHFKHMVYHFVLTYSNWEHARICFSESFESFSEGLQESVWILGGLPKAHQTDQLSAAIQKVDTKREFTDRYKALLSHYGLVGQKIQVRKPNENGDVEQSHHRFKRAVKQALMLRGSTAFDTRQEYADFLDKLLLQLNSGRKDKFEQEQRMLKELPLTKLDATKYLQARVRSSSTISIERNTYSVNSRLIGEKVTVKLQSERVEIWLGQKKQDAFPRLLGRGKARINYRHIIDSLVRKPGAFQNYRYREELFPTSRFRRAYDWLCQHKPLKSSKRYLEVLALAATENEANPSLTL